MSVFFQTSRFYSAAFGIRTIAAALFVLGVVLCNVTFVSAQGVGIGITGSPSEQKVNPGQTLGYTLQIENFDTNEQTLYLFVRNVSGSTNEGVPIFADHLERTGYEVSAWVQLPFTEMTIPAQGRAAVPVTINVPTDATPGGHFGSLFFSVEAPENTEQGAAVGYQVASPINLRVAGDIVEQASIRQFATNKFLYGSQDVTFEVRIENAGNVLVYPTGPLVVTNSLGKEVGSLVFNESRAAVFPQETRTFADIRWQGDGVGFGRYEAVLTAAYGEEGAIKNMSNTVTFWVVPMNIIGPVLAVLAVLLLITYVTVRSYVRRSMAHLQQGGRRMVRQRRRGNSATMLVLTALLIVFALFMLILLVLFA